MDTVVLDSRAVQKSPVDQDSVITGEMLVGEGLVKKEDLERALEIQAREREMRDLPLGQILLRMGALSESDLEGLCDQTGLRKKIGSLAVEEGLVTDEQLKTCLEKKKPSQLLGEVFIEEGLLGKPDVERLLKVQAGSPRIGEMALKMRLISEKDFSAALKMQKHARRLDEILCDLNLLSSSDLNHFLKMHSRRKKLGGILVELGFINQEQFLAAQKYRLGKSTPERVFIREKLITRDQLQIALSRLYDIPFKDLKDFSYSEEEKTALRATISHKYAERHSVLPISCKGSVLELALLKPEDSHVVDQLKRTYSKYSVSCILIPEEKFRTLFSLLYGRAIEGEAKQEQRTERGEEAAVDGMEIGLEEDIEEHEEKVPLHMAQDVEAEAIVNHIIKYGIVNKASDIHIEQDRKGVSLRYRIDGVMREPKLEWLKTKVREKITSVVSRIKVIANLDIAERRLPQDGVFRISFHDKTTSEKRDLDFRVATCRAIVGENVVIRILDSRNANVGLESLHHSDHVLKTFKKLLKSSAGMILVTGPTGSGKSSTLYAALQYVYDPGIKIITAEDPIEYNFPGIMQTQANSKINLTFARLLRSFLRLDPDVILIGEMRDEETAKIGFDAAQTGHLLLSTLHTNDAVASVSRLLDLNVEYGQIASCLLCALAQRLVRRICPSCIQECIPEEEEWRILFKKYPSHLKFYRGMGCPECNYTGFKGRTLISEIFTIDKDINYALNKGIDEASLKRLAVESGMKTMLEDGLLKLNQTTLSELIRALPHDMIMEFRSRTQAQDMADDLIEQMLSRGSMDVEEDPPLSSFHVTDPLRDAATIDLIRSRYEAMKNGNGGAASPVDSSLFHEFISQSFQQICEQYACKGVTFCVGGSGPDGAVEISATPDTKQIPEKCAAHA